MAARGILDDIQSGQNYVSGLFDTQAKLKAGRAYAGGDYAGASGILASRGDLEAAERVSQRGARTDVLSAVDNKDFGAARSAAASAGDTGLYGAASGSEDDETAQKTEWLTHATDALKQLPAEARQKAFTDYIAPTIKMMGADDAMLSAIDATHLTDEALDAFKASLGGKSGKRIEKVDNQIVEIDDAAGTVTPLFAAPRDSKVVDGALVGPDGRVLYTAPRYQKIGEGESLLEISGGSSAPPVASGSASAPRGLRNNNPGNIEDGAFAKSQPGYKGSDGRFAIFDSAEAGQGAQAALLQTYGSKGIDTVLGAVSRWAPKEDGNDPAAYAKYVSDRLGISPDTRLDLKNPKNARALAMAMAEFENGTRPGASGGGAARIVATGAPKRENAPSGFRFRPDGNLEPIPGGPGDPAVVQANKTGGNRKGETDLRKEFNARPEVKEFRDVSTSYRQIEKLKTQDTGPGDISLIFSFMKMLDPGSVVREGEFATAQNSGGIPDRIVNAYNKALSGERLNKKQRDEFANQARNIFDTRKTRFDEISEEYRGYAQGYDLNPDRVVSGASSAPPTAQASASAPAGAKRGADGSYYIADPSNPRSFPKVQPGKSKDGKPIWFVKGSDGSFYKVGER